MSSPWEVQENEARIYFAISEILRNEKTAKNGNKYYEMQIWLTPIEPEGQIVERKFFSFNPAWEKIIIPSVMKLVQDGKIKEPKDMEQKQFISYRWSEYKDYSQRNIQYWKDNDPDKLSADDQGRTYKPTLGLEYLNLFVTEKEWRQAAQDAELPVENNVVPIDPIVEAAKAALPAIINVCGANMTQLQERLTNPPLDRFDINSQEVKLEVAQMVVNRCGNEDDKRQAMLTEINSYFNSEIYLTIEELPETAF